MYNCKNIPYCKTCSNYTVVEGLLHGRLTVEVTGGYWKTPPPPSFRETVIRFLQKET